MYMYSVITLICLWIYMILLTSDSGSDCHERSKGSSTLYHHFANTVY